MVISDIGSTDDTALLCHTNYNGVPFSGNWFAPHGDRVNGNDVPGVTRNRGHMVVRLKKSTGTLAQGIYHCSVMDADGIDKFVHVGLYYFNEEGTYILIVYFRPCELKCYLLQEVYQYLEN